jgi:hypothetical protein
MLMGKTDDKFKMVVYGDHGREFHYCRTLKEAAVKASCIKEDLGGSVRIEVRTLGKSQPGEILRREYVGGGRRPWRTTLKKCMPSDGTLF